MFSRAMVAPRWKWGREWAARKGKEGKVRGFVVVLLLLVLVVFVLVLVLVDGWVKGVLVVRMLLLLLLCRECVPPSGVLYRVYFAARVALLLCGCDGGEVLLLLLL